LSGQVKPEESGRPSFFEKKEAKKLSVLRALATTAPPPAEPKVFWLLFFKKVTAFFLLPEIPWLHLERIDMPIRHINIPRLPPSALPRVRPAACFGLVAAAMRQRERPVAFADSGQRA
jgi:hypothetical protein